MNATVEGAFVVKNKGNFKEVWLGTELEERERCNKAARERKLFLAMKVLFDLLRIMYVELWKEMTIAARFLDARIKQLVRL